MTVRDLLAAQLAAWNTGDLDAFCAPFADDVVYLRGHGPVVGRQAVAAAYRARYPDRGAMGTLGLDLAILEERGDAAFAVVAWTLVRDGQSLAGHALLGFRRAAGGWQLAYDATLG